MEYGFIGFRQGEGTMVTVTGATTYTSSGLMEGTSYQAYVRSICTETLASNWSDVVDFSTTVGIEGVESSAISLYPNPAHSTVTVEGMEEGSTVTIVDLNGREVLSSSNATLDISHLSQGAYFVRVTGERQQVIRKLIVK